MFELSENCRNDKANKNFSREKLIVYDIHQSRQLHNLTLDLCSGVIVSFNWGYITVIVTDNLAYVHMGKLGRICAYISHKYTQANA